MCVSHAIPSEFVVKVASGDSTDSYEDKESNSEPARVGTEAAKEKVSSSEFTVEEEDQLKEEDPQDSRGSTYLN